MSDTTVNAGDNSKALKAGAWYVVSSIVVKAIAVISTPVFTRLMTTEEYGTSATFISWYTLLLTFCTLNLTYSIGRAKLDYPDRLDNYIGSMQLLSGIVTAGIIAITSIFIKTVSSLLELNVPMTVLLMLYLLFTPAINFVQNGFRYRYKYKQNIAIAWYVSLSTVLLSIVLIVLFPGDKAILRATGIVVPNCLLGVFFWIKAFKRGELTVNKEFWRYGLTLSAPLILHTVSLNILAQSDRIFINKICGSSDVGIYSLVYSYGILISVITNAVADGWLPWFHDNYYVGNFEAIKENSKKVVLLGCFMGLACIALAPEAVMVLGGRMYLVGLPCVLPVVLGIVCQYIYTHYVNIEMHLKKTKYVSYGTMFAAGLNIILNAIFIPKYGFVAAAYTTLASYLALMIVHFLISRNVLHVKLYNDLFMFGAFVVTGIIALVLEQTYNYNFIRYIITAIGFFVFVFVYREYILNFLLKRGIIKK